MTQVWPAAAELWSMLNAVAESSFPQFLEQATTEVLVFGADDLRFVQVNARARENMGYTMDELREMTPLDIKPHLSAAEFRALLDGVGPDGLRFQAQHQRRDGTLYDVQIHLSRAQLRGQAVWVALVHDITELLSAQRVIARQAQATALINTILSLVADSTSVEQLLAVVTDALVETPWLSPEQRGGAFLRQPDGSYRLVYQRRLSETVQQACARIVLGECLCGRAAAARRLVFASCVDSQHKPLPGMSAH